MKVLHVLDQLNFSGAEVMYVAASSDFQNLGCQLYVLETSKEFGKYTMYFHNAHYTVLHITYSDIIIKKCLFYNKLYHFIKKEAIDVLHVHCNGLKFEMSFLAWFCGIKCICTHHSVYHSRWYSIFYHRLQRCVISHILGGVQHSISNSVYENEKNYYHNDTFLINNWYDSNKFYPAQVDEKAIVRKKLGISMNTKIIITVGSCRELKRHKDVIDAVAILREKCPDLMYLHIGEGEMLDNEMIYAKHKGIEKHVRFLGNQTDIRKYLIISDVFVMTSRLEGISLSIIEAMACVIPTVLYHVPGLQDFNLEKECSIQIEESPEKLAFACMDIFEGKINVKVITSNARQLVCKNYNMKQNTKLIYNLYQ